MQPCCVSIRRVSAVCLHTPPPPPPLPGFTNAILFMFARNTKYRLRSQASNGQRYMLHVKPRLHSRASSEYSAWPMTSLLWTISNVSHQLTVCLLGCIMYTFSPGTADSCPMLGHQNLCTPTCTYARRTQSTEQMNHSTLGMLMVQSSDNCCSWC